MTQINSSSGFVSPVPRPASGFRPDIEGLRGIAVLLVVLYHAGVPGFRGGFIGVDVFFVLSGYLITSILVKEVERSGGVDLWQFYARRARRLLPASTLVLLVTVIVGMWVYTPMEQADVARTAFASATYMSNIWFAVNAADYFAASAETNPLLHTWSLSVEEQFYFVWPALILLALRWGGSRRRLLLVIAAVSLVSLVGSLWLTETRQAWAFYGSPVRAWEFGVGGIASLISAGWIHARRRTSLALGVGGLLLVGAGTVFYTAETRFPGLAAIVPVAGTVALLIAGVGAPGAGIGRLLALAPLQRVGQLSYSWYLWHWPVLVIAAVISPGLALPGRILCVVVALGLAAATYAYVENPIRGHPRLSLRPARSLWMAVLITVFAGGISLGWRHSALRASESPRHQQFAAAAQDRHQLGDCNATFGEEHVQGCVFGDTAADRSVVLFGDSHAAQWFPAFEILAREQGWRLVTMTKSACPAVPLPVVDRRLRHPEECSNWRESAMDRIMALDTDLVVLASAPRRYRQSTSKWQKAFDSTFRRLDSAGIATLVLWGTPVSGQNIPHCLSRATVQRRDPIEACAVDRSAAMYTAPFKGAQRAASGRAHVRVADLSGYFCEDGVCDPVVRGAIVLYDDNHLTATMAERMAPTLAKYVSPLLWRAPAPKPPRRALPYGTSSINRMN
jgi:peptidoglycan/LPS O-acetylase OafA/YrhL